MCVCDNNFKPNKLCRINVCAVSPLHYFGWTLNAKVIGQSSRPRDEKFSVFTRATLFQGEYKLWPISWAISIEYRLVTNKRQTQTDRHSDIAPALAYSQHLAGKKWLPNCHVSCADTPLQPKCSTGAVKKFLRLSANLASRHICL